MRSVLMTAVICLILVGSAVAALTLMTNSSSNPQTTETPNPTSAANPTITPTPKSTTPTVTINQPDTLPQGYIYANQALEIAKPYYMNYTQKNNRTITEIKITYSNSTAETSVHIPPDRWRHFPGWIVEAYFQRYPWVEVPPPATPVPHDPGKNYWDIDYYVIIQADTAQVIEYSVFMSA